MQALLSRYFRPFVVTVFLALCMLCIPPLPVYAGDAGYSDISRPTDFRGIAFGARFADVPNLSPVGSKIPQGSTKFKNVYYRENESLQLFEANILSIAYYFRDDRMRSVVVTFQGDVNEFMIKDSLIGSYGQGRQRGRLYGWTWDDFSIVLGPVPGTEVHSLTYTLERAPQ